MHTPGKILGLYSRKKSVVRQQKSIFGNVGGKNNKIKKIDCKSDFRETPPALKKPESTTSTSRRP